MSKQDDKKKEEQISELDKCAQQREEYLNEWRRAAADLENYKRAEASRTAETVCYSRREILKEFLPILDSLDRAQENQVKDTGLKLVLAQLEAVLKNNGVKKIEVKKGDNFDPAKHNAVSQVPAEEDELADKVTEVISAGYNLDGKVIRAAKVIIAIKK